MAGRNKKNKKAKKAEEVKKIAATKQVEEPQQVKGKKIPPDSIEQAQKNRQQQLSKVKLENAVKKVEEAVEENLPDAVKVIKVVAFGDEVFNQDEPGTVCQNFNKDKLQTAVDAVTKTWQAEEAAVAEATVITQPVTETDSATDKPAATTETIREQIKDLEEERKKREDEASAAAATGISDEEREKIATDKKIFAEAAAFIAEEEEEAISFFTAIFNQSLFKLWLSYHWKAVLVGLVLVAGLVVAMLTMGDTLNQGLAYLSKLWNSNWKTITIVAVLSVVLLVMIGIIISVAKNRASDSKPADAHGWWQDHWKVVLICAAGVISLGIFIVVLAYPTDNTLNWLQQWGVDRLGNSDKPEKVLSPFNFALLIASGLVFLSSAFALTVRKDTLVKLVDNVELNNEEKKDEK